IVLPAPGPGDDALKAALEKYKDRVVIGCNITLRDTDRGGQRTLMWPSETVLASTDLEDDRVGYVNIYDDPDGIFRRAIYQLSYDQTDGTIPPDKVIRSLAARML